MTKTYAELRQLLIDEMTRPAPPHQRVLYVNPSTFRDGIEEGLWCEHGTYFNNRCPEKGCKGAKAVAREEPR